MPDTMMTPDASLIENQSPQIGKIAAALALAQKNFAPIPKDREVTVHSDRGNYKFKYATLDAIRSATMPALAEQALALVQGMTAAGNGYAVETKLVHSSGEWMRNLTPMFVSGRVKDGRQFPPTNQELGSAQSYARRYGLSALLCITADEDDDGNTADGNHIAGSERVPFKPGVKGSAGGGTHFKGERRGPINMVEEARQDGTLNETRPKGQLADKPPAAKKTAAEKAKEWTDIAIKTIGLSGQTVGTLRKFEESSKDKIEWLEANAPLQHERFYEAFNEAKEAAQAVAA